MSTKKGRNWRKEWESFKLTPKNTTFLSKPKLVKTCYIKDYVELTLGFGRGKTLRLSNMNISQLASYIFSEYISVLPINSRIGFVLEYWTSDYHRKFTGYVDYVDSGSLLLESLRKLKKRHSDLVLMFVEIRQEMALEEISIGSYNLKDVKVKPVIVVRSILKYEYIRDFGGFARIKGSVSKHGLKSKVFRDWLKSYIYKRDVNKTKDLTLKLVGVYYLRSGLRLKVLDKCFIYKGSISRRTRYIYVYKIVSLKFESVRVFIMVKIMAFIEACKASSEGSSPSFTSILVIERFLRKVVFDIGTERALGVGLIHASWMKSVHFMCWHGERVSNSRECS